MSEDVLSALDAIKKLVIKVIVNKKECKIFGKGVDGYKYTIVSGKVTYVDGVSTGELPGRLIRS